MLIGWSACFSEASIRTSRETNYPVYRPTKLFRDRFSCFAMPRPQVNSCRFLEARLGPSLTVGDISAN